MQPANQRICAKQPPPPGTSSSTAINRRCQALQRHLFRATWWTSWPSEGIPHVSHFEHDSIIRPSRMASNYDTEELKILKEEI